MKLFVAFFLSLVPFTAVAGEIQPIHKWFNEQLTGAGTSLEIIQDAAKTTLVMTGPAVTKNVQHDIATLTISFKTKYCKFRPDDRLIMECAPGQRLDVTASGIEGDDLTEALGDVDSLVFTLGKRLILTSDPTKDFSQITWHTTLFAKSIPGGSAHFGVSWAKEESPVR